MLVLYGNSLVSRFDVVEQLVAKIRLAPYLVDP